MRFLLTNDDGWGTDGLQTLEKVVSQFGEVVVVAPDLPQSGISHQLTFESPLNLVQRSENSYELNGTPADCVRIAMTQLGTRFDWVFSGINHGSNLGADTYVSGTVAAAREAWLQGANAAAISQFRNGRIGGPFDWNLADQLTKRIIGFLFENIQPDNRALINVNYPDVSHNPSMIDEIQLKWCELDPNPLPTQFVSTSEGFVYNGVYRDRQREKGFDIDLCFSGNVAITKLA